MSESTIREFISFLKQIPNHRLLKTLNSIQFRYVAVWLILLILLNSCASIFNPKTTNITIHTSEKATIKVEQQGVFQNIIDRREYKVEALRSEEHLKVSALTAETSNEVHVKPKNSFAYILNHFPVTPYGVNVVAGILIDKNRPKRYTYPKHVYIDLKGEKGTYLTYKPLDSINQKKLNILKINPFRSFSFEHGGVEFSYERKVNNEMTYQLSATYLLPKIANFNGFKPRDVKGFELGLEGRYYLKESAPIGPYFASELRYLNSNHKSTDTFIADNDYYTIVYDDEFRVSKKTVSFNAKIGKQLFIKRLLIDVYVGAGLRYKNVSHSDKIDPNGVLNDDRFFLDIDVKYLNNKEGKYWILNPSAGFKIGYLF